METNDGNRSALDSHCPLEQAKMKSTVFAAMSRDERIAARDKAIRMLCDLELIPPELDTSPDPDKFGFDSLRFAMNGGMAQTRGGRLWAVWIAGGDSITAYTVGSWSDDGGKTWTGTRFRIGSDEPIFHVGWTGLHMARLISNFWFAPDSSLRLYVYQALGMFNNRGATFEFICRNPDDPKPEWEQPRLIALGGIHNKPIVLRNGTWILPNDSECIQWPTRNTDVFPDMHSYHGVGVLASVDNGMTWEKRGHALPTATKHYCENSIVERSDGSLHMLFRSGLGVMESVSNDIGYTWSEPILTTELKQHLARASYIRLASGRMMFVKNGTKADEFSSFENDPNVFRGRGELTAFFSEDEGRTWKGGLVLDPRGNVCYPDAFQALDGSIYVSYEHGRDTLKNEILFAHFNEEDLVAGKIVTQKSSLQEVVFSQKSQ